MVKLYTTASCKDCMKTKMAMEIHSIAFEEISLDENPKMLEFIKQKGFRQMPVIESDGKWLSGYDHKAIAALK